MRARMFAGLVVASVLAAVGCGSPGSPAARSPVVASINGTPVSLATFESYLVVHFVEEPLEEPVPREDTDRVQSRLFDDFIAESLLVLEAERRGVQIEPAEIGDWLGDQADPDPARQSARREQARRELLARHLVDAWMRAEAKAGSGDEPQETNPDFAAKRLIAILRARYPVVLCDRSVLDNYVYLLLAAGQQPALDRLVDSWMTTYDVLITVPITGALAADGLRAIDPDFQHAVNDRGWWGLGSRSRHNTRTPMRLYSSPAITSRPPTGGHE